jgi:hypothetical protein
VVKVYQFQDLHQLWQNKDMKALHSRSLWSRVLIILGSLAMVVGAIDPMEGAAIILPGSLLVALGTCLGPFDRRLIAYRVTDFLLIAFGVGAMWILSAAGGIGGKSGLSMWWGVLILPYLVGWSMGMWGPGSPRWLLVSGIGVSLWYLVIVEKVLRHSKPDGGSLVVLVLALTSLLTIAGCLRRLIVRIPKPS